MQSLDLQESTSFFEHVYLWYTQREYKSIDIIVEEYTKMLESRISAAVTKNCLAGKKNLTQKQLHELTTWKVMLRNTWKDTMNW